MAFKSTVDYTKLKSVLSLLKLKAPFTYQNLQITDVLLDAESKNLFFTTDVTALTVTISEATAFALDKGIADAATIAEVYVSAFSAAKAETLSVAESAALESELNKSETTSLTDSPVFNAGKSLTDTPIITESLASAFAKALADTSSISEVSTLASGKNIGNPDTSSTVTYTVTVASGVNSYGGGNKYYFNGAVSPEIDFELGVTYRFDQSHVSNSNHPLRFSTTANGTHGGGTAYTTNVTVSGTPGQAGAYVEIDFDTFANSLHYYCAVHSGMGNKIITRPTQIVTMLESFARTATFERVFTDATSLDDTASASDDLATESGINKNNIVSVAESLNISDLNKGLTDTTSIAESLAKTVSFQRTFSDTPTIGEAFAYALALDTIANNVSVSESINIQLTSGASSVLNASALNPYTINS